MGFESESIQTKTGRLDGQKFKTYVEAALLWLRANQQVINNLNVFPVPDGDTGTNMVLTMQSAYNEIAKSEESNLGKMAHLLAQGALMGARGNSGVILSQLWRGFARALDNYDSADALMLANAFEEARNTAYKGVVKPVEGTILTVATDIAKKAREIVSVSTDSEILLDEVVKAADVSVQHTPELLPVLKQAGVVDSGGKGLFVLLEGILRYIRNQSLETPIAVVQKLSSMNMEQTMESVEPGQDYEVVVDFYPTKELNLESFYADLGEMGTSIQVGEGDGFYRMHIHVPTENRFLPIDYTMKLGTVTKVAIENLMDQMESQQGGTKKELKLNTVEPGEIALVTISPGHGLSEIFASLGANAIVDGGQTMNPSTEEILKAFEDLPTDQIIILPNNKNIILAAQTAASVSVKKVAVIPSKNIPQGLSAILHLQPDGDFDTIIKDMNDALSDVETGEITTATRSVQINDVDVAEGQVIALHNGTLITSTDNLQEAIIHFLEAAQTQDHERITLFYGSNIKKLQVDEIVTAIQDIYPDHEIEVHSGGQPYYQFIISVE